MDVIKEFKKNYFFKDKIHFIGLRPKLRTIQLRFWVRSASTQCQNLFT